MEQILHYLHLEKNIHIGFELTYAVGLKTLTQL